MKTEKLSAYAMVNCKVCRSAITYHLQLRVECINAINPVIQSKTPSTVTQIRDSMLDIIRFLKYV
jgi:hypothetical protein